ncbi:hypothetical protein GTQ34_14310 [Muricauda sp. JGD-17]|uniref:Glycosyl transferase n=1 Tax=Flagellimonas ochracea TaxID=2696472 RepID=A0A964TDT8_9FLAO|nr:glycosyltransferase [Allomuricauda ochracea]NAY93090.1 hypothetical protein [Allomuricauda ochracea]
MKIKPEEIPDAVSLEKGKITQIVHQTWKTSVVPDNYKGWVDSWEKHNPHFHHVLWEDKVIIEFINTEYPEYLDLLGRLRRPVELADFFRYLVVYHFGGIYADLDTECLQPIDPILETNDDFFCCVEKCCPDEQTMKALRLVRPLQLCQWFFGGVKGCVLLKSLCDRISTNYPPNRVASWGLEETLQHTGPGVFTDMVLKAKEEKQNVTVYPQYFFANGSCGTTGFEDDYPSLVASIPQSIHKQHLVFIHHHFSGSWKT